MAYFAHHKKGRVKDLSTKAMAFRPGVGDAKYRKEARKGNRSPHDFFNKL